MDMEFLHGSIDRAMIEPASLALRIGALPDDRHHGNPLGTCIERLPLRRDAAFPLRSVPSIRLRPMHTVDMRRDATIALARVAQDLLVSLGEFSADAKVMAFLELLPHIRATAACGNLKILQPVPD